VYGLLNGGFREAKKPRRTAAFIIGEAVEGEDLIVSVSVGFSGGSQAIVQGCLDTLNFPIGHFLILWGVSEIRYTFR
jgi:hypothetical protein